MQLRQFPEKDRFCRLAQTYNVVPLCVEVLADMQTPVLLLKQFYEPTASLFLLESVEGGERWGRYSFLGISNRCHIRVYADTMTFADARGLRRVDHGGMPFKRLSEFMQTFRPAAVAELPRFWGGLVGYLTYEAVSFIENLVNRNPKDTPLAQFVLPDVLILFDNVRHTMCCVAIAYLEDHLNAEKAYAAAESRIASILAQLRRAPGLSPGKRSVSVPRRMHTPPADEFQTSVRAVKDHIRKGEVIQAVISQSFQYEPAPDPWLLYRAQRYINPSPYLFFLKLDGMTLVGSSPETMVRLENGVATLRPIAGTRPRGKSEKEDRRLADELLKDEKERAEHLMLVDLGRNDLGRIAETGSVQVTELMFVERYSHVMHLVSNITCDLKPTLNAWDLLEATFPAGTLTGAPKVRAMEIIADLEADARGPYGGAVGYIGFDGNMDMAITIRTASIEHDRLTVRAGAGIVADSHPEAEYRESVNKAMAIERAIALMDQS